MATITDAGLHRQIRDHAEELKSMYAERDSQALNMEKLYKLEWDDRNKVEQEGSDVRATLSPDPRVSVQGITRLMSSSDAQINLPFDKSDTEARSASEAIEKFASVMWRNASRIYGAPLHRDVVLSTTLYDEVHIGVVSTSDMVSYVQGTSPANVSRAKRVNQMTPYMFQVFNPRSGYPEFDDFGLTGYYRTSTMKAGQVIDQFGAEAEAVLKNIKRYKGRFSEVTLCDWWDLTYRCVWVEDGAQPILFEEHKLPFIPIVVRVGEGSRMFNEYADQREPFLYTEFESGFWKRANLAYTALYTMLARIGLGPTFVEQLTTPGTPLARIDTTGGITRIVVQAGNSFQVLQSKGILDAAFTYAVDLAERKGTESMIFRTALGQPLSGATSFSEVALMAQAGRLPIIPIQQASSWAIADALKVALMWMKHEPKKYKAQEKGKAYELTASQIPEHFELEVQLEVKLPQDKLQQANIAQMLNREGLTSRRWIQENLLGVAQSEDMQAEVWEEQAEQALFGAMLQKEIQKMMQPPQPPQPMQPPQPGPGMQGLPPGGPPPMPPGGGMQGLPPEMAMMGGQGIPPEMMGGPGLGGEMGENPLEEMMEGGMV